MLMLVTIPGNLQPGDLFSVAASGQEWSITCPDGVFGGQELEVELPIEDEEPHQTGCAPSYSDFVDVSVPDGIGPGDEFLVELCDGFQFYVMAPAGA